MSTPATLAGLTPLQTSVLAALSLVRSPHTAAQLAIRCDLNINLARKAGNDLAGMGYVERHQVDTSGVGFTITHRGREALSVARGESIAGFVSLQRTRNVTPSPYHGEPGSTYGGEELRPFTGRPGAMDAYRLPSRGIGG